MSTEDYLTEVERTYEKSRKDRILAAVVSLTTEEDAVGIVLNLKSMEELTVVSEFIKCLHDNEPDICNLSDEEDAAVNHVLEKLFTEGL